MLTLLKSLLVTFLLIVITVVNPPIGLLVILSLASHSQRKSKFAARTRIKRLQADRRLSVRAYFWSRKAIWSPIRSGQRRVKRYYSRTGTLISIAVCTFATYLALGLMFSHANTALVTDFVAYGIRQVIITGFLAGSIGALAWKLFSIELAFRSVFVTFVASLIVAGCIFYGRLMAIDFFSEIFPFPPTYTSVAFSTATALFAASLASLVFAIIALLFEIALLLLLSSDFSKNKLLTALLVVALGSGFLGAGLAMYVMSEPLYPKGRLLIIKLAEQYDFTGNHMCDARSEERVLFIENMPDRAFAVTFPKFPGASPKKLTEDFVAEYMPKNFRTVRCNPIASPVTDVGWCKKPSRLGYCRDEPSVSESAH